MDKLLLDHILVQKVQRQINEDLPNLKDIGIREIMSSELFHQELFSQQRTNGLKGRVVNESSMSCTPPPDEFSSEEN